MLPIREKSNLNRLVQSHHLRDKTMSCCLSLVSAVIPSICDWKATHTRPLLLNWTNELRILRKRKHCINNLSDMRQVSEFSTIQMPGIFTLRPQRMAGRPRGRSSSWSKVSNFLIGSEAHPGSYPIGIGASFAGGKAACAWSSPITSRADAKKTDLYIHSPYDFMLKCLVDQA
jgi:hypothetical protein